VRAASGAALRAGFEKIGLKLIITICDVSQSSFGDGRNDMEPTAAAN
jgi:hypothetical protein